ncbi:MAG: helix-hairpin-helix domain-containing protein [Chloroflexota bacterium]
MADTRPTQDDVADVLEQIAALLEAQGANPFRINSYRDGARTIRASDEPIVEWAAREDIAALKALPDIGEGLAGIIVEYVKSGRSALLEELQSQVSPQALFRRVPGIGEALARRIVSELQVTSLEELEQAAYDGRLAAVEGFGEQRLRNVRAGLAGMVSRSALQHRRQMAEEQQQASARPPVKLLLEIDESYRRQAAAGELKQIAPKRFNPGGEAWLPIMKTEQDGWQFTVLYSNTARAHELGKTHDWVVIYYRPADGGEERQNTVVTESSGPLAGRRVVRGREAETRRHYAQET